MKQIKEEMNNKNNEIALNQKEITNLKNNLYINPSKIIIRKYYIKTRKKL